MKMVKRILALLPAPILCLFLFITGCTSSGDESVMKESMTTPPQTIAETTETEAVTEHTEIEDMRYVLSYHVKEHDKDLPYTRYGIHGTSYDGTLCFFGYDGDVLKLYSPTDDGYTMTMQSVPIQIIGEFTVFHAVSLENENILLLAKDIDHSICKLMILDSGGNLVREQEIPDGYDTELFVDHAEDGSLHILYNNQEYLLYYDETLTCLGQYPSPGMNSGAVFMEKGVYRIGIRANSLSVVNMLNQETEAYVIRLPETLSNARIYRGLDGQDYYATSTALFQYRDAEQPICVLEWAQAEISVPDPFSSSFWILNSSAMLTTEPDEQQIGTVLLSVLTEQILVRDQTVITVGCFGGGFGSDKIQLVNQAAAAFEQNHEQYRVSVRLYKESDLSLEDVMLSGEIPDVLLVSSDALLKNILDKNILYDMKQELSGYLLPSLENAYTMADGQMLHIPLFISADFLVTAGEDAAPLTWDTLFHEMESLKDGELLFTESSLLRELYELSLMDFVDYDSKTSSFHSEKFRDIIQFLHQAQDVIDPNAGYLTSVQGNGTIPDYYMTHPSMRDRLADGGLRYLQLPLRSADAYQAAKLIFDDTPIALCGNPGNGAFNMDITVFMSLAVNRNGQHTDAAMEFAKFMLSEQIQTDYDTLLSSLPVTEQALYTCFRYRKYSYYDVYQMEDIRNPKSYLTDDVHTVDENGIWSFHTYRMGTMISPDYIASEPLTQFSESFYQENYEILQITDDEISQIVEVFKNAKICSYIDPTVISIVNEELSYWQNNARTLEETTKIIDSRVWIYLNE